jgi:hypothetical protein
MDEIILGDGVFAIGATNIALTRGGGKFNIDRDYRQIEADGDYGPVKGRIRKIKSVATLSMSALQIVVTDIPKMYPALKNTNVVGPPITDTITAEKDIKVTDYSTVTWTGKTANGRSVIITLDNAINLEKINWGLKDKDEVVQELTYTATYDEASRDVEPWKIQFGA